MKKVRFAGLVVCLAVMVGLTLAPAAAATSASLASGEWSWYGGEFVPADLVDGHQYFSGYELGIWTGTFQGTSVEPFVGVIYPDGSLWALITVKFKGAVDGVRGKFVMQLTVDAPLDATMGGQWAIMSGSGRLKDLRGVGTWVFTDADDVYGYADYSGVIWWR